MMQDLIRCVLQMRYVKLETPTYMFFLCVFFYIICIYVSEQYDTFFVKDGN